jgi:hypothetical protein
MLIGMMVEYWRLKCAEYAARTELSSSCESTSSLVTSKISQHFMGPESSLSCLQEPCVDSYHQPYESRTHHRILILSDVV